MKMGQYDWYKKASLYPPSLSPLNLHDARGELDSREW